VIPKFKGEQERSFNPTKGKKDGKKFGGRTHNIKNTRKKSVGGFPRGDVVHVAWGEDHWRRGKRVLRAQLHRKKKGGEYLFTHSPIKTRLQIGRYGEVGENG